jgi:hypothetical protein
MRFVCRLLTSALALTAACAGRIQAPPLPSHRVRTAELELRFGGFEHTRMGLKQLQRMTLLVDRLNGTWSLHRVSLTRNHAAACSSGVAAILLDTSAGRTGAGDIVVEGRVRIDAGFSADEAEHVCEGPCRVDLLFEDHARQPRCVTMQLTR